MEAKSPQRELQGTGVPISTRPSGAPPTEILGLFHPSPGPVCTGVPKRQRESQHLSSLFHREETKRASSGQVRPGRPALQPSSRKAVPASALGQGFGDRKT